MSKDLYSKLSMHHFAKEIMQKKKNRLVIFGNFGACNFGDEAILAGELQELITIPECRIKVISRFPSTVTSLHNVASISLFSLPTIIKEIIRSSGIIIGGGGIVCKNSGGLWSLFYQLYFYFLSLFLPLLLRKNVYVLGIGFYSNAHPLVKILYAKSFLKARMVTVRDAVSLAVLKQYNVPVLLYKDSSFHMTLLPKESIRQNPYFAAMYNASRFHVGLSLKQPQNKIDEELLMQSLAQFIMNHAENTDFWFYSLDYHPRYENDKLFGQKLYRQVKKLYKKPFSIHFVPVTLSVQDAFSSFQMMDCMITMRFHGSVFAYRQNIPFLGITYDEKCTSFLESIGKNAYHIYEVSETLLEKLWHDATYPIHKTIVKADIETTVIKRRKSPKVHHKTEAVMYGN